MNWMITARLEAVPDTLRRWYTESELRQRLADDLAPESDRISDAAFAREYQQHCPVPGVADPGSYNNRVVELADGSRCLTGIRFRGGDLSRPFVDLVAVEGTLDPLRIAEIADEVDIAWAPFEPRAIRLFHPDPIGFLEHDRSGTQPDQFVLAAPVTQLRHHGLRDADASGIWLRPAADLEWYDRYVAELEDLFTTDPMLQEMTRAESRDDLAETRRAGLLFEIRVGDNWAGVLASPRDAGFGMRGHSMQEIMLAAEYRGRGIAVTAERQLIMRLSAGSGDVLFGTIDARNSPSLRTAQAVGRRVVGGYLWLYPRRIQHAAPIAPGWDRTQLELFGGGGYAAAVHN